MKITKETVKKYLPYLAVFALGMFLGWYARVLTHTCPVQVPLPDKVTEKVDVSTTAKTEIGYEPKAAVTDANGVKALEKTDIDVKIPKQSLTVKVNGKTAELKKDSAESYLFEKNKLSMVQTSTASIDIKIPTVDNTRKWEAGIGIGKHGMAGIVSYPIKGNLGGWVAGDKESIMAGVTIKF